MGKPVNASRRSSLYRLILRRYALDPPAVAPFEDRTVLEDDELAAASARLEGTADRPAPSFEASRTGTRRADDAAADDAAADALGGEAASPLRRQPIGGTPPISPRPSNFDDSLTLVDRREFDAASSVVEPNRRRSPHRQRRGDDHAIGTGARRPGPVDAELGASRGPPSRPRLLSARSEWSAQGF